MAIRKFLVIDQNKYGDENIEVCGTLEEANKEAEYQWSHLTRNEQKIRHIFVAHVEDSADYLNDWAFDEDDGTVDYTAYHSTDTGDGYFDSEEEEAE